MYIPKPIRQPRYRYAHGYYYVHPAFSNHAELHNWITSLAYQSHETEQHRLNRHSRKRNSLYVFKPPFLPARAVLKVSSISPDYRFWRKLNLLITGWFKDYNRNAFFASLGYEANDIDCLQCIAYWTCHLPSQSKKSYLLYHYVDAELSASELISRLQTNQRNPSVVIEAIARKIGSIVRRIHSSYLRHGDPHSGNFLIHLGEHRVEELTQDAIASLTFTLVDLDKSEFVRVHNRFIKKFFDLRCLRRFRIGNRTGAELIEYYTGTHENILEQRIVRFWQRGGFHLYKWLRPNKLH